VLIEFKAIIGVRGEISQSEANRITKFKFEELRSICGTERLSITQLPVFEAEHMLAI
jgi:hypothetical protein